MAGIRRWQEEESPEMKTPATFKEQVKSHPLDVDSDSEVWLGGAITGHTLCNASAYGHSWLKHGRLYQRSRTLEKLVLAT